MPNWIRRTLGGSDQSDWAKRLEQEVDDESQSRISEERRRERDLEDQRKVFCNKYGHIIEANLGAILNLVKKNKRLKDRGYMLLRPDEYWRGGRKPYWKYSSWKYSWRNSEVSVWAVAYWAKGYGGDDDHWNSLALVQFRPNAQEPKLATVEIGTHGNGPRCTVEDFSEQWLQTQLEALVVKPLAT